MLRAFHLLTRVILPLLICGVSSLTAQEISVTTLYSFTGSDGSDTHALIQASDGDFYGTTAFGGPGTCGTDPGMPDNEVVGCGTVFKITASGAFTSLYAFTGGLNGEFPTTLVQGSDGNLYGTTVEGGSSTECETDPGQPDNVVVGCGTIFMITPSGTFKSLYSFTGDADGAYPNALVQGSDGNFYGTGVKGGGINPFGTVFKITLGGDLTWLYNFTGGSDGAYPDALVQGSDGNFYGTTQFGNVSSACPGPGCGTVFVMTPSGNLTTLYTFQGGSDGADSRPGPVSHIARPVTPIDLNGAKNLARDVDAFSPALVEGSDGEFFGITPTFASVERAPAIKGTMYEVSTSGSLTTLYTFTGVSDGGGSLLGLALGSDGNFYGTSGQVVFSATSSGGLNPIYTFSGQSDGGLPWRVIQGSDGNLYGTAKAGGNLADCNDAGCGTVFRLSFSPGLPAPIQLSLSASSVTLGTAVSLNWAAINAFSATSQQCYAFVQGGGTGGGNWTGLQSGELTNNLYSGSAMITPTASGTYTYALTCGGRESGFATLTVPPLGVTTTSSALPGAFVGAPFSATLAANDGLTPYTWSINSGSLAPGLSLAATTGIISGTPTQAGTYNFTVQVSDSEGTPATASANLSLTVVAPALSANPTALSIASPGASVNAVLAVSGFASNSITFSCSGLPAGASCAFGSLSGSGASGMVTLQITTTAPTSLLRQPGHGKRLQEIYRMALPSFIAFAGIFFGRIRRFGFSKILSLAFTGFLVASLAACGGSSSGGLSNSTPGTPAGSSTVTVTAIDGSQSSSITLAVTVQ